MAQSHGHEFCKNQEIFGELIAVIIITMLIYSRQIKIIMYNKDYHDKRLPEGFVPGYASFSFQNFYPTFLCAIQKGNPMINRRNNEEYLYLLGTTKLKLILFLSIQPDNENRHRLSQLLLIITWIFDHGMKHQICINTPLFFVWQYKRRQKPKCSRPFVNMYMV